jgi:hypothetical protein
MVSVKKVFAACLALALVMTLSAPVWAAQEKDEALKKKYAAYIGAYEFELEGQVMVINFWVEEGAFWGAPEGEEKAELTPVEGEAHQFEVDVMGEYYEITFAADEAGKFNKCIVLSMGQEMQGVKIEK